MNVCVFDGRLTADPELRYTQSNKPVANFGLAVSGWRKNDAGERDVTFLRCTAW